MDRGANKMTELTKLVKINARECKCSTYIGTQLMLQIVRRYFLFKAKTKRRPRILILGQNQKKIIENDEILSSNLAFQNIEYSNHTSQLKYK